MVLVQPLIVAELLFALPLAPAARGSRLGRREWTGAVLIRLGLITFVVIVRPADLAASASWRTWLLIVCVIAGLVALLLHAAERRDGVKRTSAFAVAAGISLVLVSALTKLTMRDFGNRGLGAFATLAPWAVIAVGILGLWLAQTAFGSGPLAVSLPLIDIGGPLVASLVAVMAFGERLGNVTVAKSTGLALAAGIIACGVVLLDHSPVVHAAQARLVPPAAVERGPSRVGRTHPEGCLSPAWGCAPSFHVPDIRPLVPDGHSTTNM